MDLDNQTPIQDLLNEQPPIKVQPSMNGQPLVDGAHAQGGAVNYDYNYSMSDILSAYDTGVFTSANVGIFLCLCGITFNLVLVTLVLGSKTLRNQYIYNQIASIALADLGFVVTVDCFSVYNDVHKWTFGTRFCKAWMILDVALPTVSIVCVLLLNADRILFMYHARLYETIVKRFATRAMVLLYPWFSSGVLVCSLWLGFSEVEPKPGLCVYGITKEANNASTLLTVFIPAFSIVILVAFLCIANSDDMPTESTTLRHRNGQSSNTNQNAIRREEFTLVQSSPERPSGTTTTSTTANTMTSDPRRHRRILVSILAVDFVSLLLSIPYTAFSHLSPTCNDVSSCQSLITLFQSLSWMRSSVTCFRPLLFIFLTQARFVCVREEDFCCCRKRSSSYSYSSSSISRSRLVGGSIPQENTTSSSHNNEPQQMTMTSIIETRIASASIHISDEVSTSRTVSPPNSPAISTKSKRDILSYSAKTSIPCEGDERNSVTFI